MLLVSSNWSQYEFFADGIHNDFNCGINKYPDNLRSEFVCLANYQKSKPNGNMEGDMGLVFHIEHEDRDTNWKKVRKGKYKGIRIVRPTNRVRRMAVVLQHRTIIN